MPAVPFYLRRQHGIMELDVLRPVPERLPAKRRQLRQSLGDGQEVVARELAGFA